MRRCIRVYLVNHGKVLYRKTIPIRGAFKFQILAAGKVLSILSSGKEILVNAQKATIELDGIDPASSDMFIKLVKKYAPLPVEIVFIERKEVKT